MPIILAAREAEIRKITVRGQHGKMFRGAYLQSTQHKKGLAE
jgi:hypothetical protein